MSMDVLNPDYDKLKREVNRFADIYDRYMSCCGYTRYWYIAGNNYYGNYHVVGVWLKGDRDTYTIINMNICVEYGTGAIWYSRVRPFEGGCCSGYILTSRKPRKNNRREFVDNPEDQLLGLDTVREIVFGMEKELSIDESVNVKFDYEII